MWTQRKVGLCRYDRCCSSEESEDPRRPRAQPATTNNNDQKKKKKKKLPPQKSINRIWKKFSKRKFHKALAVLPFDPVQSPATYYSNELLSAGYQRAAEECRRMVEKIIKECKRVNMRYRDPGWDLDWDLRYEKGHCLNHLGSQKFELNRTTLLSSKAAVPKAVKRVHEIFENPTFMKEVSGGDVKQGSIGDCWIMAGLTALANVPGGLQRICVAHDTKIGIYGFVFYRDGEWIYSIIDDKLYLKSPLWDCPSMQRDLLQQIDREDNENVYRKTYQTGSKALFFSQCRDQNETWVPLFEKAYAKPHGDYASLEGGWIGEGVEDLSGGKEMSRVNDEFLFGAYTGFLEHGYGVRDGIAEAHAYVVMKACTLKSGQRLVKLRNPWGKVRKGIWEGAWSDDSKEWTTEVQEEMDHKFGNWRCCQRWIGVDVPWKAAYHEKFHIKLTQNSPLVLVLSQLDGRYFKGLHGQYSFRLHFRLHYEDSPNVEDYIVRSHGNYLMERSVSVELRDLPAGNYVVYLKVTGERDSNAQSVEQVVKREAADRTENEKLAQVGYAYDLAHSKAWDHMDKVTKLRQKKDQKKASASRQKERRRMWEKRATKRDVAKQQTKKNADKRKRHRAEWEAEQNRLDEEFNAKVKAEREQMKKERLAKTEAQKAAEAEKRALEADDEALRKKTEEIKISEDKDEPVVVYEHHKDHDDAVISVSTGSPHLAPNSMDSTAESAEEKHEDWEALYSSDDMARKPYLPQANQAAAQDDYDSEEEKMPEPWNAICIVGVRVYSEDENLELRTVMEGGELLEGGMGSKGAADLDNAQSNVGGGRADNQDASKIKQDDAEGQEISPGIGKDSKDTEYVSV
ncbi:hypothetical protein FPRO04_13307 [Fusarium proliferatum]|nr:hypothetical protein FPRO04_13307 [Fusarium proliferatum]